MISPPVTTLSADPAIDDAAMERQASAAWAALGATPTGRQTRRAIAALLVALADVEGTAGGEVRS